MTTQASSTELLDEQEMTALLAEGGPIHNSLRGFEVRDSQQKMLAQVVDAYNNEKIALVEAGTGTGKSLAYLIPSILYALGNNERVLISTHTINLQEQLYHKDIPFLVEALNLKMKSVLVKGMSNYLCLRKLEDATALSAMYEPDQKAEIEHIDGWSRKTQDGSKSDLNILPSHDTWDKVCAEADTCNHVRCPHYKNCFFFKARKEAQDAQVLVVNHHLLFADLSARAESNNYNNPSLLPVYRHIVIDEAHHIEEIATEYFASKVSRVALIKTLAKISAERKNSRAPGRLLRSKRS